MKLPKLPSGVRIFPDRSGKSEYWVLRLGKRWTKGQVTRRTFRTAQLALAAWEQEQKQHAAHGVNGNVLSPSQLGEAVDAFRRLAGTELTLSQAVSYALRNFRPKDKSVSIPELCKEFLKTRRAMGVKPRTLAQYDSYCRVIAQAFTKPVHQIQRMEIEEWLDNDEWGQRTRNNYLSTLSTLLNFGKERDYRNDNPCDSIPKAILDDTPVGILTPDQAATLLNTAREQMPEMLAFVALGLFAGIRRSEIVALEWSEIDRDCQTIHILATKAKTRQRRIVRICTALLDWLDIAPKSPRPAPSKNTDVCGEHLRELVKKAGIENYPRNALRHSFGSYHLAQHCNIEDTALQMGNSGDVIIKHYRETVMPKSAERYWTIRPSSMAVS